MLLLNKHNEEMKIKPRSTKSVVGLQKEIPRIVCQGKSKACELYDTNVKNNGN